LDPASANPTDHFWKVWQNFFTYTGSVVARIFSALVLVGCSLSGRVRHADSCLGDSHFCFCALPQSSFSALVFLMEHWSPVSSVGSVNVVRYAARWRSCNIVYIKLFVHNMIHLLLSSGLVQKNGTFSRPGQVLTLWQRLALL